MTRSLRSQLQSESASHEGSSMMRPPHRQEESIRESVLYHDKMQPSSTIIFSISNAMIGPTILLLPLNIANIGILSSSIVAVVIGWISHRTCQLTHLHTKLDEIEYLPAIKRILGSGWMYLYFLSSVLILWMAAMIYFLSLSDVMYSCVQLIFSNHSFPPESKTVFDQFSYQYTGIILMALVGGFFFLRKLGRILDFAEKGIYSIGIEAIFSFYVGIKAILDGKVNIVWNSEDIKKDIGMFVASASLVETIGVYATAFIIHNAVVAIVRKNKQQKNNYRDVRIAYIITFLMYIVTGAFGAIGIYTYIPSDVVPNTVLSKELFRDPDLATKILLIVTQIFTALQLMSVLPVLNNVIRTQLFIMIYGEHGVPPSYSYIIFNILFILSLLITQMFNISPNKVMTYAGAFIGFIITYLLPVATHVKTIRTRQKRERERYGLLDKEGAETIADFIQAKPKIYYAWEYILYGVIMAIGTAIFVLQILKVFNVIN